MKILVTGGAGYLGSTLVPMLLGEGHTVHVADSLLYGGEPLLAVWAHPQFHFTKVDMRDKKELSAVLTGVDAVVHLAAIVGDPACAREPELAKAINLEASLKLLHDAERAKIKRFIFASTCSNYGKMADPSRFIDENSPLAPVSLYAETKVAVEKVLLSERAAMTATALRFSTLYGVSPRMRFDLTVNEFTRDLFQRKALEVFGEQFWRPYVHVWDAARAILLALAAPGKKVQRQVFNVGDNSQNFQKKQLIELLQKKIQGTSVKYVRKDEDPRDYRVSFDKIRTQLGFHITKTVPEGMDEVLGLLESGVLQDASGTATHN